MQLSVVISQYNESENIKAGVLEQINGYLSKQGFDWEVIIVDDGSTDDSLKICEDHVKMLPGFRIIKTNHGGKPHGLFEGVKEAKYDWILLADMDQSTPITELPKLLQYKDEYNVIIGSRGIKRNQNSLLRKLAGGSFSTFRRAFILTKIVDTQCGFKLFKADQLKLYFPKLTNINKSNVKGWTVSAFDVELLFVLAHAGNKIKEVPVEWKNTDLSNTKDKKFINESLDMAKQILLIQLNKIRRKY